MLGNIFIGSIFITIVAVILICVVVGKDLTRIHCISSVAAHKVENYRYVLKFFGQNIKIYV